MKDKFSESEIPFSELSGLGLSREMIEDLPMNVLDDIICGNRSPVLPMVVSDDTGAQRLVRSRFRLTRDDRGNVSLLLLPELKKIPMSAFSKSQQSRLKDGKPIVLSLADASGKVAQSVVQVDRETRQVLVADAAVIFKNLSLAGDKFSLSKAEVGVLQKGEPMTFAVTDGPVTVGIDLSEPSGTRVTIGDVDTWRHASRQTWDTYNFGVYGCWVKEDSGNLKYISEVDYTDELWEAQRRVGQARALSLGR